MSTLIPIYPISIASIGITVAPSASANPDTQSVVEAVIPAAPHSLLDYFNQLVHEAQDNQTDLGNDWRTNNTWRDRIRFIKKEYQHALKALEYAEINCKREAHRAQWFRNYKKAADNRRKVCQEQIATLERDAKHLVSEFFGDIFEELEAIPNPFPKIMRAVKNLSYKRNSPHIRAVTEWLESDTYSKKPLSLPSRRLDIKLCIALRHLLSKDAILDLTWISFIRARHNTRTNYQDSNGEWTKNCPLRRDEDQETAEILTSATDLRHLLTDPKLFIPEIADIIIDYWRDDMMYAFTYPSKTLQDLYTAFSQIDQTEQDKKETTSLKEELEQNLKKRCPIPFMQYTLQTINKSNWRFNELHHNSNQLPLDKIKNFQLSLSETEQKIIGDWLGGYCCLKFNPQFLVALHNLLATPGAKKLLAESLVLFVCALVDEKTVNSELDDKTVHKDQEFWNKIAELRTVVNANYQTITDQADAILGWLARNKLEKVKHLYLVNSNLSLFSWEILNLMKCCLNISTINLDPTRFRTIPETLKTPIANYHRLRKQLTHQNSEQRG